MTLAPVARMINLVSRTSSPTLTCVASTTSPNPLIKVAPFFFNKAATPPVNRRTTESLRLIMSGKLAENESGLTSMP